MKQRFLLGAFLVIFSATAKAQINKGMWTIGGNIAYSSNTIERQERTTKDFSFNPSVGFVISDNRIFGFNLAYTVSKIEAPNFNRDVKGYGFGVFYRQYYGVTNRLLAFGNLDLGYFNRKQETESQFPNPADEMKFQSVALGFSPGLSFALSKRFQLETSLGNFLSVNYQVAESVQNGDKEKSFNFGINGNPFSNLNLGLRIFLGGAKQTSTSE